MSYFLYNLRFLIQSHFITITLGIFEIKKETIHKGGLSKNFSQDKEK